MEALPSIDISKYKRVAKNNSSDPIYFNSTYYVKQFDFIYNYKLTNRNFEGILISIQNHKHFISCNEVLIKL